MTEVSASADNTAHAQAPAPYAVPHPPATQPITSAASVEWDHTGRVIAARFSGGHGSKFRYDANGVLYGFSYARLAWSTMDGVNWTARDQANDYTMSGRVDVGMDGAIKIEKATITRVLKLNGVISDRFPDGTIAQSIRDDAEPSAADLLASVHPRASVREPQHVMQATFCNIDEAAGTPPSAKTEESESAVSGRRVVAGGRRMSVSRLRDAEDKAASAEPAAQDVVANAKQSVEEFLTANVVRLLELAKGAEAPELPKFLDKLAVICHRERRVDEARVLHERALNIRAHQLGADHSDTGVNLHGLGRIYLEWGRYVEAEQYLLDAVKVFDKGLRKTKFLFSAEAVDSSILSEALRNLIGALHSLASLYHEQKKLHLCSQLCDTAVSATNGVTAEYRVGINAALESLAAMAAQAEMDPKQTYNRIRAQR